MLWEISIFHVVSSTLDADLQLFDRHHQKLSNLLLKLENSIHHSLVFGKQRSAPSLLTKSIKHVINLGENCCMKCTFFNIFKRFRVPSALATFYILLHENQLKTFLVVSDAQSLLAFLFHLFYVFLHNINVCDKKKQFVKNFTFKNMIIHHDGASTPWNTKSEDLCNLHDECLLCVALDFHERNHSKELRAFN